MGPEHLFPARAAPGPAAMGHLEGQEGDPRQERAVRHLGSGAPGFQVGGRAWNSLPRLLSPWTVGACPPRGLTADQQQVREGQAPSAVSGPGRRQTDLS